MTKGLIIWGQHNTEQWKSKYRGQVQDVLHIHNSVIFFLRRHKNQIAGILGSSDSEGKQNDLGI